MQHFGKQLALILGILGSILLSNILIFAQEQHMNQITVIASVTPSRIIVVNNELLITEVISNTAEDIRPIVVQGEADGVELPYTDQIATQYQQLKSEINFSKPGIIYTHEDRPIQALFQKIAALIGKLFSFSLF